MTQRDLDEAVARLRAASSRNDPTAADLDPDLGPPRGRPETAGQGPLDPDIVDAHAHVVTGHEAPPPSGGQALPRSDWEQPLPRESVVGPPPQRQPVSPQGAAISPEARARAEAQLRAAVEARGRATPQSAPTPRAEPRPAQARSAHPGPAHAQPAPRPVPEPPAPVLDDYDRRNRLGDPENLDDGIVTDDHVEAPRRGGLLDRFRRSRDRKPTPTQRRPETRARRSRTETQRGPLTPKEERWRRRKRRYLLEEILGWILVPVILVGLYFAILWGLSLFGLTLDDVVAGAQQAWEALN
ncbi:hypothetical protein [Salinarimonas sp.]|uniref:hypothetical protein n=1 Tax=Salinarimonas sp. TaxID=2766526 RepID=UPI0032D93CF3